LQNKNGAFSTTFQVGGMSIKQSQSKLFVYNYVLIVNLPRELKGFIQKCREDNKQKMRNGKEFEVARIFCSC